jgi:branched-chain amino acid transport system permease protein
MSLGLYYYLQLTALFIMLGWTLYWVYRIGQLNNAPIAIMAIGAYLSAYAVLKWGWPFPLAFAFGVVCGTGFSFIPALALGRAPAFSMVIATIALIFIMQTVFRNLPWFGGSLGLFGIPKIKSLLWITYGFLIFFGILIYRFDHSRLGRAADVVFEDRDVAGTLGVNFYLFSVCLQVMTGFIGAVVGVLYAFTIRTVIPMYFGFPFLLAVTTFIFVGGYTTMWGVIVFTPILWGIPLILPENMAVYRNFIYGVLLMGTLILRSEGVIDRRLLKKFEMLVRLWGRKLFQKKGEEVIRAQKENV